MNNRVNRKGKKKVRVLVKEIQEIILFIIPFSRPSEASNVFIN